MPSVITANLLRSGDVVYLAKGEEWVRLLEDAEIAQDKDALKTLEEIAQRAEARQLVVEAYPMDVDVVDGRAKARSVREVIRAQHGPTV